MRCLSPWRSRPVSTALATLTLKERVLLSLLPVLTGIGRPRANPGQQYEPGNASDLDMVKAEPGR